MKKIEFLRKKYPKFIYQKYSYKLLRNNLEIFFDFKIQPGPIPMQNLPFSKMVDRYGAGIFFKPKIIIENVKKSQLNRIKLNSPGILNNLIFHLGLIEIPSYWKTTCSPEIEILADPLNKEQIRWWKDLILKGMGQFYFENKIDFRQPNFLKIKSIDDILRPTYQPHLNSVKLKNKILVPIGGGKDSIVTLEKLIAETPKRQGSTKEKEEKIVCFLVNPTKAMREIVRVSGIKEVIIVKREIDPTLLELNKRGFLNGHTPFSAVLSFLSVFCAVLFGYRNIAFSNEKSANEGNLLYLGRIINHQWSKSSEFEKKFRNYCQKYLVKGINYFSFLRKYNELEIAKMFTKYPKYFSVFSSCNVVLAKKLKKRWCGKCPKCLFVYVSLYPFLDKKQLLKIFGRDIFENKKLLPAMKSLIGKGIHKPFECVGTFQESKKAFQMSFQKAKKEGKIPYLLTKLK